MSNKIRKEDVTIGFDPEFLLKDNILNKHVSGLSYEFGPKGEGKEICPGCTVENDMVTVELVLPPVELLGGTKPMWDTFKTVKDLVEASMPSHIGLDCCSSAEYSDDELADERAMTGGCSTDFNAWNDGLPNEKPKFFTKNRCAGAHIHMGYANMNYEMMLNLTKMADLFISVPLVLVQTNIERRKMYGAAGAFRCQEGRVEFRSPSNCYWQNEESLSWVFRQLERIVDTYNNDSEIMQKINNSSELIINAINNDDKTLAELLIGQFELEKCPLTELV